MAKFKVLCGKYRAEGRVYQSGEVVETRSDLTRLNIGGTIRFEPVSDDTPVSMGRPELTPGAHAVAAATASNTNDTLEKMTLAELRAFAASEEIDLGTAKTKEQVIEMIQKAL